MTTQEAPRVVLTGVVRPDSLAAKVVTANVVGEPTRRILLTDGDDEPDDPDDPQGGWGGH